MELHSVISLQNSLAHAGRLLEATNNIGTSDDGEDLYYLIDFLSHLVDQTYPALPCRTGCNTCCIENGLPRTSALEWKHIHRYLSSVMEPETLKQVLAQNKTMHQPQIKAFLQEQQRIESPESLMPMKGFECTRCPFIVADKCSIYPVRPAICRGFGAFTWRPSSDQEAQIFACQMAADALLESLQEAGIPHVALPRWNGISDKIYALNQALSTAVMSTLPLWLFSHTDGESLLPLNLSPDFHQLQG